MRLTAITLSMLVAGVAGAGECPLSQQQHAQPVVHQVVHVVSTPLTVQEVILSAAPSKDIVDTAVGAGSFNTLVTAVKAAGLVDALKGDGPLTVFAPTDEAFAKVDEATLASLLKPENQSKLQAILKYHVVSGKVLAADVVKLTEAVTLEGSTVDIKVANGTVKVDNATVVKTDIECSNGVIHVIDAVIMP